jgi:glycosyltransferase involved in cell wall biosynthesis
VVVSEVEREVLATDAPGEPVFVLSNIHKVNGTSTPFSGRKDLFFVGGYQHPPNIDAAQWFVQSIWPLVREQLPGVTFHLVGSKAPDSVRKLGEHEGVKFHGFVDSVEPFLDGCRLSVAPLRYGAGVKGKVNQSMAHGQPVVATPMAVEGLHATHGHDVLVAQDEAAFAAEVVRLYQDEALWNSISAHAVENVREHFSLDTARRDLDALFRALQ